MAFSQQDRCHIHVCASDKCPLLLNNYSFPLLMGKYSYRKNNKLLPDGISQNLSKPHMEGQLFICAPPNVGIIINQRILDYWQLSGVWEEVIFCF